MNAALQWINSAGTGFVEFSAAMLIQSGVLITLLLLIDFGLRRKVRAVFRYWLWMLVFVKLVLPTSLATPVSIGRLAGDKLDYFSTQQVWHTDPEAANTMREQATAENVGVGTTSAMETYPPVTPAPAPSTSNPTQIEPDALQPTTLAGVQDRPGAITWQAVLFLVWVVIAAAMGLLLLQRAFFVRGLVAQSWQPGSLLIDALEFCRKQMHLRCRVGLKVSVNTVSPAVCGLFRPVILVPASLASNLSSRDLRMVLMHELAHIKRGDLWVNLAQTLLQIAYFYNPLLWLANAAIRRVREQAVDEAVMAAMGERAGWYPETLVNVAKTAFRRPALGLRLIGVVESKNALAGRIKHILSRPFPKSAKLGLIGLIIIITAGAILLPMAEARQKTTEQQNELKIKKTIDKFWQALDSEDFESISKRLDAEYIRKLYGQAHGLEVWVRAVLAEQEEIHNSGSDLRSPDQVHIVDDHAVALVTDVHDQQDYYYHLREHNNDWLIVFCGYCNKSTKPKQIIESSDLNSVEKVATKANKSNAFKATLPNGVTVELVGLYYGKMLTTWNSGIPMVH
jgi:beta-lactamase regulating signal transducer with metallopeptidase domain